MASTDLHSDHTSSNEDRISAPGELKGDGFALEDAANLVLLAEAAYAQACANAELVISIGGLESEAAQQAIALQERAGAVRDMVAAARNGQRPITGELRNLVATTAQHVAVSSTANVATAITHTMHRAEALQAELHLTADAHKRIAVLSDGLNAQNYVQYFAALDETIGQLSPDAQKAAGDLIMQAMNDSPTMRRAKQSESNMTPEDRRAAATQREENIALIRQIRADENNAAYFPALDKMRLYKLGTMDGTRPLLEQIKAGQISAEDADKWVEKQIQRRVGMSAEVVNDLWNSHPREIKEEIIEHYGNPPNIRQMTDAWAKLNPQDISAAFAALKKAGDDVSQLTHEQRQIVSLASFMIPADAGIALQSMAHLAREREQYQGTTLSAEQLAFQHAYDSLYDTSIPLQEREETFAQLLRQQGVGGSLATRATVEFASRELLKVIDQDPEAARSQFLSADFKNSAVVKQYESALKKPLFSNSFSTDQYNDVDAQAIMGTSKGAYAASGAIFAYSQKVALDSGHYKNRRMTPEQRETYAAEMDALYEQSSTALSQAMASGQVAMAQGNIKEAKLAAREASEEIAQTHGALAGRVAGSTLETVGVAVAGTQTARRKSGTAIEVAAQFSSAVASGDAEMKDAAVKRAEIGVERTLDGVIGEDNARKSSTAVGLTLRGNLTQLAKAAERNVLGTSFFEQEVRDQVDTLNAKGWAGFRTGNQGTFDRNNDGKLDFKEIVETLKKHGIDSLEDVDTNKDGQISGKELTNVMTQVVRDEGAKLRK